MLSKIFKLIVSLSLKVFKFTIFLIFFDCMLTTPLMAEEKIGNLVFNAMKKIKENHESFLNDVQKVRGQRKAAVTEREAAKGKYKTSRNNTLDKREAHAYFCLAQAKVFNALYKETRLTNEVAKKQLGILQKLQVEIDKAPAGGDAAASASLFKVSKTFLDNGRVLMESLAEYKDKIRDPVINTKLNTAYDTAVMFAQYAKSLEKASFNKNNTKHILAQKIAELTDILSNLYVQTDMFADMIRDKTTVLKMINEVAAAEMTITILADSSSSVNYLNENVMKPLMDAFEESGETIDALTEDVLNGNLSDATTPPSSNQRWAKGNFVR